MARKSKNSSEEQSSEEQLDASFAAQDVAADSFNRSRCGGALNQARQVQGLSVQDVASKLRLSPKQIEAIEADDFAKLPESTIVRGFIRNYAKLLKINAEPLLDAYSVIVPTSVQYQLTVKPTSNMQVTGGDKPKPSSYILVGFVLLMALGAWLFYQNYVQKPSPIKPSATVEDMDLEPLPEAALPAAERAAELQASTELTLPAPADVLPATPADANAPVGAAPVNPAPAIAADAALAASPTVAVPTETAALPEAATNGLAKLEFNANQETWVSVIDAEGKTVYDKIIFAGSRESIEAKPPLNVTVGNAGATSLNMNGKPVDLAPHSRNNIARIKLE